MVDPSLLGAATGSATKLATGIAVSGAATGIGGILTGGAVLITALAAANIVNLSVALVVVLIFLAILAFGGYFLFGSILSYQLGFMPLWGWLIALFILKILFSRK